MQNYGLEKRRVEFLKLQCFDILGTIAVGMQERKKRKGVVAEVRDVRISILSKL